MARTTLRLSRTWRPARLVAAWPETATGRTLRLRVPGWPGHAAGQHVDVRLTAENGYTAVRSYSLSAPADGDTIELTVEEVPVGEVSSYLGHGFTVGDELEVLGPLGGWFVWRPNQPEPALLVGGGSGVAPLMAMRRAHRQAGAHAPMHLVYSVRSPESVLFRAELLGPPATDVTVLYTRTAPAGHHRDPHRIGTADLGPAGMAPAAGPTCYVCGPTSFVETVIELLTTAGHDPARIRAERFGGSGESVGATRTTGATTGATTAATTAATTRRGAPDA